MFAPAACVFRNTIIVPIAVLPPSLPGGEPQLVCPPFIVPTGTWTLVWNLVTLNTPEAPLATFPEEQGVVPLLGTSQKFDSFRRISDTQWINTLTNPEDKAKAKATPLSYLIRFYYGLPVEPNLFTSQDRRVIGHDPTIVVSQDPVEPPSGW
jgi:hypothetical protein